MIGGGGRFGGDGEEWLFCQTAGVGYSYRVCAGRRADGARGGRR